MPSPTQNYPEKFLKRLAGRTDLDDALKKLDKLTNEEARMATAQNLKATHTVDDRVKVVDVKVDSVGSGVKELIDGTSTVFVADCWSPKWIDPHSLGGREAKVVIDKTANDVERTANDVERTANDVDQLKRSSSRKLIHFDIQAQPFSRREPIVTKPSKMALPIGPVYQS